MTHFTALILPPILLGLLRLAYRAEVRRRENDPYSPTLGVIVWEWVKHLLRRDPDPDPDPDTDDGSGVEVTDSGHLLRQDPERPGRWDVVGRLRGSPESPRVVVPPARVEPPREASALEVWVTASLAGGAAYGTIVREGSRMFGTSESTVKRVIRGVRAQDG